jgi:hypothetical protein
MKSGLRPFFVIQLIFLLQSVVAQDTTARYRPIEKLEKSIDLWLGYHLQFNASDEKGKTPFKYLEVGIGKGRYLYHRHGIGASGFYLSEEILLN